MATESTDLTREEMEMIRTHASFAASDAAGETNPPNPGKIERWAGIAQKMRRRLDIHYGAPGKAGR
jgi:hypothetical protein